MAKNVDVYLNGPHTIGPKAKPRTEVHDWSNSGCVTHDGLNIPKIEVSRLATSFPKCRSSMIWSTIFEGAVLANVLYNGQNATYTPCRIEPTRSGLRCPPEWSCTIVSLGPMSVANISTFRVVERIDDCVPLDP